MKKIKLLLAPIMAISFIFGCHQSKNSIIHPITFANTTEIPLSEFDDFYARRDISPTEHYNARLDYGYVKDKYHSLKINGKKVETYTALCESNLHSFAWVDVEKTDKMSLNVELKLLTKDKESVVVLPEKSGVIPSFNSKTGVVKAKITEYGNYSFAFDIKPDKAFTLIVAPYEPLVVPNGYKIKEIKPGTYLNDTLIFKEEKTVYYFKAGYYKITKMFLPSNAIFYFEPGFSAMVYDDETIGADKTHPVIYFNGVNSKVCGRGLFDCSQCMGGDEKTKGTFTFDYSHKGGIDVSGLIIINSHSWTLCCTDCDYVHIHQCLLLGFRMYSDGIMLSNCRDSLVEDNFVHTGDDAIEAKSTNEQGFTNNLIYQHNAVWSDKANCYGCIYESVHDIKNVHFLDNSVGFAMGEWSNHLGACTVSMGSKNSTFSDIHFTNTEVYYSNNPAVCNVNIRGYAEKISSGTIDNVHFTNITTKYNTKLIVSVFTENAENEEIGDLYFSNIKSKDHVLQKEDYSNDTFVRIDTNKFLENEFHVINSVN